MCRPYFLLQHREIGLRNWRIVGFIWFVGDCSDVTSPKANHGYDAVARLIRVNREAADTIVPHAAPVYELGCQQSKKVWESFVYTQPWRLNCHERLEIAPNMKILKHPLKVKDRPSCFHSVQVQATSQFHTTPSVHRSMHPDLMLDSFDKYCTSLWCYPNKSRSGQ